MTNDLYNIGDLFLFMDTDLYVVTNIKTEYAFHSDISAKKIDYQYTLLLLNPQKKLKLRKRYMLGDGLYRALNSSNNPQWKHFPVRN